MSFAAKKQFENKPKCAETGGVCDAWETAEEKTSKAGNLYRKCTKCDNLLKRPKDGCQHEQWKHGVSQKEGPNHFRKYKVCRDCDQFEWTGLPVETQAQAQPAQQLSGQKRPSDELEEGEVLRETRQVKQAVSQVMTTAQQILQAVTEIQKAVRPSETNT